MDPALRAGPRLVPPEPAAVAPLIVSALGMHVRAATTVDGCDRKRLERVCRYLLRPPFALGRRPSLPRRPRATAAGAAALPPRRDGRPR